MQCYRIRISKTTEIPPLSESVIPGHCNRQVKLNTPAVLRPTETFSEKCDLIIAKELVNLEKKCDTSSCNEHYRQTQSVIQRLVSVYV